MQKKTRTHLHKGNDRSFAGSLSFFLAVSRYEGFPDRQSKVVNTRVQGLFKGYRG